LHGRLAQQGFRAFETRPQDRAILFVENVADIIIKPNSAEFRQNAGQMRYYTFADSLEISYFQNY
jgi:hypothetical protein